MDEAEIAADATTTPPLLRPDPHDARFAPPRDPRTGRFLPSEKQLDRPDVWLMTFAVVATAFLAAAMGAFAGCAGFLWTQHHGWF